jgi:hypothetical protein
MGDVFEPPRLALSPAAPAPNVVASEPEWEMRADALGGIWGYVRDEGDVGRLYLPRIATYRFARGSDVVEAVPDPAAALDVVEDAYYRHVLPLALHFHGYHVVHGSAVSDGSVVHAFSGGSHVGKSTLAYALRRRGYEICADDAVAFAGGGNDAVYALPLPFTLRIRAESAAFFAGGGSPRNGTVERIGLVSTQLRPIASLSLLERGPAGIVRINPAEAMTAILGQVFHFSIEAPAAKRRLASELLQLVSSAVVFRVSLPSSLEALDATITDLERSVFAGATR